MPSRCSPIPRVPRPRVDPLTSLGDVLAVLQVAVTRPLQHETVTLFLDGRRCGFGLTVVTGTAASDAVLTVADCMAVTAEQIVEVDGLVLTSIRPGGGMEPGDVERWGELRLLLAHRGLELVEWLVLGRHGPELPRAMAGGASPWTS